MVSTLTANFDLHAETGQAANDSLRQVDIAPPAPEIDDEAIRALVQDTVRTYRPLLDQLGDEQSQLARHLSLHEAALAVRELRRSYPWITPLEDCDRASVESALSPAPDEGSDPEPLIEHAVRLLYALAHERPCAGGNKRIGFTLMRVFLQANSWDVQVPTGIAADMITVAADPERDRDEVLADLRTALRPYFCRAPRASA